ncbi:hypothetical protein ACIRBY_06015 [Streptomyces sp. NPDC096136]|uniref:hypothetical protein n=1 Tax=Streptomyces sp. NPDC096136 TaxID=3366076 RepID=UPI0037F99C7D
MSAAPAHGSTGPLGAPGPDLLHSLARWRLRPGVTASVLTGGLHLRGWDSSVTLEGSPALPALWRLLEEALRTGGAAGLSARAAAGSPVRAGLCALIGRLHAHGMLVEEPAPPRGGPAGDWLLDVCDRPAEAAAALAGSRVEVRAADPGGALAAAAVRALGRAGITAEPVADPAAGGDGRVLVRARRADGAEWAVGAAVHAGGAFATPAGDPARAAADTAALAERLGPDRQPPPPAPPSAALTALVAGAAVQRLLCALAGLPDPAAEGDGDSGGTDRARGTGGADGAGGTSRADDAGRGGGTDPARGTDPAGGTDRGDTPPGAGTLRRADRGGGAGLGRGVAEPRPGFPFVLVAGERPARAAYHPWPAGSRYPAPPPRTLAEALDGVAALGDERLGVLAAPSAGGLPQLPVALARCGAPGGGALTAGAARTDLARLDALCRAAELGCGAGRSGVVVGAGPGHALGRALRRAALRLPAPAPGAAPGDPYGNGHPQARHWWGVLTRRLGVRAELYLTPLDAVGTAYRADVRAAEGRPGRLLGQAVEATAGDAAAFAALAAVVRVRAQALVPAGRHLTSPGGEVCVLAAAGVEPAPWEDESWAAGWWAAVARREAALHTVLRALTGLRTAAWEPAGPEERTLCAALRGCGFTVLGVQDARVRPAAVSVSANANVNVNVNVNDREGAHR